MALISGMREAAACSAAFTMVEHMARHVELDARDLRCLSGADALATLAGHRPGSVSDAIVPSVIGMFGRTAVAVEDQIRVVIKRIPTRGDMEVTVFASVAPVLPTSDFWITA